MVNESWRVTNDGSNGTSPSDGIVQDEYARLYGFIITKAGGNRENSPDQDTCPHSLNSICVGSATGAHAISCFSSFQNPGFNFSANSPWKNGARSSN